MLIKKPTDILGKANTLILIFIKYYEIGNLYLIEPIDLLTEPNDSISYDVLCLHEKYTILLILSVYLKIIDSTNCMDIYSLSLEYFVPFETNNDYYKCISLNGI